MATSSPPPLVVVVRDHDDDAVVGGDSDKEFADQQAAAGPGARLITPVGGEAQNRLGRRGTRGRSSESGASGRSSSSCSASRISRAKRCSWNSDLTAPVPPIPIRFLSSTSTPTCTSTSTSTSVAPGLVNVSRARRKSLTATTTTSSGGSRSGVAGGRNTSNNNNQDDLLFHHRAVGNSRTTTRTTGGSNATGLGEDSSSTHITPKFPRPRSLHTHANSTMARSVAPDLFFEVAGEDSNDNHNTHNNPSNAIHAHAHAHRRSMSRTSNIDKRRSLPPDLMPRPSTSGGGAGAGGSGLGFNRPSPRLQHVSRASTDLQRHMDQYNGPRLQQNDDTTSQAGRRRGFTATAQRSPLSPRSPDTPQYGRRRPSFGVMASHLQESQETSNSEQKPAESASSDTQSVDTVWDELDDLKSRIKKLELTGKLPTTSSAAVSGGSSDRPRTATTAPTTIDSSPKQGRKREQPTPHAMTPPPQPDTPTTPAGLNVTNIHPLLHNALAKAKPLLNSNLFRSLEATASDALQLAAMTGSAGPQGTTFSAASIINGVTVSDRHVRRKADNMCRNLTDLCLALCEGKHEAPSVFSSPSTTEPVLQRSPSLRYTRSGLGSASTIRPASRLEARRSSILGAPPSTASDLSPRGSVGDLSNYSQEQSPPQQSPHSYLQAPQRTSRAPNSRLRSRLQSHDDVSGNEDEDHTVRPLSRAMTDAGSFRARPRIISESRTPGPGQHRTSTSSLRDSIMSSRNNDDVYEHNRGSSYGAEPRYSSDSTTTQRKRQSQLYNTPPTVTEEDDNTLRGGDFQSTLQSRRRVTSQQQYSSRRAEAIAVQRRSGEGGLQQRRHLAME